jgi:general secretion pathway protein G
MKTRIHRTHARRGFTLLEMMLVVMIMGVLVGVAAWNIMSQGDKARRAATFQTMKTLQGMLDTYNLDYGVYPPTLDPLVPKYTAKMPLDAWKRPIIYSVTPGNQHPYVLFSYGPSGDQSAADTIDFWIEDQPPAPH